MQLATPKAPSEHVGLSGKQQATPSFICSEYDLVRSSWDAKIKPKA